MSDKDPVQGAKVFAKMGVIGAGSWGTALASLCAQNGRETLLWSRNVQVADAVNETHENMVYLPGVSLPTSLKAVTDLAGMAGCEALLFVAPAQSARSILTLLADALNHVAIPVALCCKGVERGTLKLMNEVLEEVWPEAKGAVLSGPSFARDVAKGLPTAVTLACPDRELQGRWLASLQSASFRPYASSDIIGAELGGAVKNVLAIACGIVEGRGLGESAKAALMARGFVEFQRLGLAMGASPGTLAGLSGLGDLILTCSSRQSRNMSLGFEIGQGKRAQEILNQRNSVSEGAASAVAVIELAARQGVEMPICQGVADIVEKGAEVDVIINALMQRPLRSE